MSENVLRRWLDPGTAQGWFWDPSNPDRRVPGLLEVGDRRSPRVQLWDSIEPIERSEGGLSWPVRQEFAVVHGQTNLGKVTLLEATVDHFGSLAMSTAAKWFGTLHARAAYLGSAYESAVIEHRRFRVRLDGLDLLVPFTLASHTVKMPVITYTVDLSQTVQGRADGMAVTVEMQSTDGGWRLGESSGSQHVLSVEVIVNGECDDPMGLDGWTAGFIDPLRHLVGFALGKLTVLRSVQRMDTIAHPSGDGSTYTDGRPLVGTGMSLDDEPVKKLLFGPLVSFRDPGIIERWWALWNDERKRDVVQRLANAARRETSPKSRFNDLAEAAEGWHKAIYGGSAKLGARLDALLAPLATWKVDHSLLATRKETVAARNAVAHGDVLPEMSKAAQTLRMLVRYHVALSLGIDPDKAGQRVVEAENWSWR